MGVIETLSLAMGTAWTSGINLYATVAALGLAGRYELIHLPPGLEVLMSPLVIGFACFMYIVEFFADKVPYVDSGWDAMHTFFRIPAGAALAYGTVGNEVNPALQLIATMAGGGVALAAHGTKATARLAINTSPEPFTNWAASVGEDLAVFAGIWTIFNYPLLMLLFVAAFTATAIWLIPKFFYLFKRAIASIRAWFRGQPTQAQTPAVKTPTAS
jgi:hypothetical protein